MKIENDVLPEGHPDPMLMSKDDLANAAVHFATHGEKLSSGFLFGVLFARTSVEAAGVVLHLG